VTVNTPTSQSNSGQLRARARARVYVCVYVCVCVCVCVCACVCVQSVAMVSQQMSAQQRASVGSTLQHGEPMPYTAQHDVPQRKRKCAKGSKPCCL